MLQVLTSLLMTCFRITQVHVNFIPTYQSTSFRVYGLYMTKYINKKIFFSNKTSIRTRIYLHHFVWRDLEHSNCSLALYWSGSRRSIRLIRSYHHISPGGCSLHASQPLSTYQGILSGKSKKINSQYPAIMHRADTARLAITIIRTTRTN